MTHFASYTTQNNQIFVIDDDGNQISFCEEFYIAENLYDICTGKVTFVIKIVTSNGLTSTVKMSRREATMNPLPKLSDGGLSVSNISEYTTTLTEVIYDMEKNTPVTLVHSKLGFQEIIGTKVFLTAETQTPLGLSRYVDYEILKPRGTFEEWRIGIIPFLDEKPEMTLAIAMGASAPIAGLLKTAGVLTDGNIFALIGPSSRGKSSALRTSSGVWGMASTDGAIDTLGDTESYFMETLAQKNSFPHFADETTSCKWDFTSLIYSVSLNRSRGRCKSDGSLKPIKKWTPNSLVFTGELSMVSQSRGTSGIGARVISFDFEWTKDAAYAEKLAKFTSTQYGTAYKPFIESLTAIPLSDLSNMYQAHIDNLKQRITPMSGVEDRILKKLSLLRLTIEIMELAWSIPVDYSAIDTLLVEAFEQNASKTDKYESVYESLLQYVSSHENQFPDEKSLKTPALAKIAKQGMTSKYNHQACVWIMSDFFEEFLSDRGLEPTNSTLHTMKDRKMLVHFKDRFRKKQELSPDKGILCYCLLLSNSAPSSATTKKKKKTTKSKNRHLLLSEDDEN